MTSFKLAISDDDSLACDKEKKNNIGVSSKRWNNCNKKLSCDQKSHNKTNYKYFFLIEILKRKPDKIFFFSLLMVFLPSRGARGSAHHELCGKMEHRGPRKGRDLQRKKEILNLLETNGGQATQPTPGTPKTITKARPPIRPDQSTRRMLFSGVSARHRSHLARIKMQTIHPNPGPQTRRGRRRRRGDRRGRDMWHGGRGETEEGRQGRGGKSGMKKWSPWRLGICMEFPWELIGWKEWGGRASVSRGEDGRWHYWRRWGLRRSAPCG